jgi:glyoxylase-like metal-dependent hydrolase (beta-lactamase superfamily II)
LFARRKKSATVSGMQLEDHLGDILRKARLRTGISTTAAANAADISKTELDALEHSGRVAGKINFPALAQILRLHPKKLEDIAHGWLPAGKKLSRWRGLRTFTTSDDDLSVNCFLIGNETSHEAALFDTGLDATPVLNFLAEENLSLRHIFITHSHYDHVAALPKIRAAFPAAEIHSGYAQAPAKQRLAPGQVIALGDWQISHRATPGHADDGTTYLITGWPERAPAVAIVGDTILAGSLCNGNGQWEIAEKKIREEILTLPDETLLCPGHGPITTVAEEIKNNPFF